jgi:hypothetical protein
VPSTTEPSSVDSKGQSPLILGLAGLVLVLLIGFGIKQMKDHKTSKSKKGPKDETQKDYLGGVSTAVGREETMDEFAASSTGSDERELLDSAETEKQTSYRSGAIPLGADVVENITGSPESPIEKAVSSEPAVGKSSPENDAGEQKNAAGGKAIPMGYAPGKKNEKESDEKDKTQETKNGSAE